MLEVLAEVSWTADSAEFVVDGAERVVEEVCAKAPEAKHISAAIKRP